MVGDSDTVVGLRPGGVKRKRASRVTSGQIEALLGKLEASPFLFTRKFTGIQGRENFESGWREIADELNQLPNGSIKTAEQWMTVWRDFKSRACNKAAKLKKEIQQTGNRSIITPPLNEIEKKIVSLVGVEYTFGTDCPDSLPEEDIIQLEINNNNKETTSVPHSQSNEIDLLEMETEIISYHQPSTSQRGSRVAAVVSPQITETQTILESPPPQITTPSNREPHMQTTRQHSSRRNRNLNPRRSIAELHEVAKKDFLQIAQSNAESMKMLAAASQLQAEAAKMQAEAAKVQAEAARAKADALTIFAEAINKISDAVVLLVNKKN